LKNGLGSFEKALNEAIHETGMLPAKFKPGKAFPMLIAQPLLAGAQKPLDILYALWLARLSIFSDLPIHMQKKASRVMGAPASKPFPGSLPEWNECRRDLKISLPPKGDEWELTRCINCRAKYKILKPCLFPKQLGTYS
jgi:hypothetical protein